MKNTLIDAGPLLALFNKNDHYHFKIIEFLKSYKGLLTSSWPVITEACHMLDFNVNAQIDFLKWIQIGGLRIEEINLNEIGRIIDLSKKYSDVLMDLADASLLILSERLQIKEVITIDSDYYIYRTINKTIIKNVFKDKA